MPDRTLDTELFGRDVQFAYAAAWIGYAVVGLRVIMAYVFLQAGVEKLLANGFEGLRTDPLTGGWSAAGYFAYGVHENNPVPWLWEAVAAAGWVSPVVIWTQILIGFALLFGVTVRLAAFGGALQMLLFWLSSLHGGLFAGLPVEHGYVVSYHLVYALLLFGLGAIGAGRVLGIDRRLEATDPVKRWSWLRCLLG